MDRREFLGCVVAAGAAMADVREGRGAEGALRASLEFGDGRRLPLYAVTEGGGAGFLSFRCDNVGFECNEPGFLCLRKGGRVFRAPVNNRRITVLPGDNVSVTIPGAVVAACLLRGV